MSYFYIESERLRLIPLNYEHLCAYTEPEKLAQLLDLSLHKIEMEEPFASGFLGALENFWKPKVLANTANYQWFTNWLIVLKETKRSIGGIGLRGLPNENGETETGYGIDLNHRGKGYVSEAVKCLTNWAFQQPNVKAIIAHTLIEPNASQAVLQKNGFVLIGKIFDEEDEQEVLKWRLEK